MYHNAIIGHMAAAPGPLACPTRSANRLAYPSPSARPPSPS